MPKKLIFLFDGTSNEIDIDDPTNVLLLASGVSNRDKERNLQLIFYKKGVGTSETDRSGENGAFEKVSAGFGELHGMVSGKGVYNNILQAYEDLCFNYELGDEIYVFGFSRGAYTARSFCGFIHANGIAKRVCIENILNADRTYRRKGGAGFFSENDNERAQRFLDETVGACCTRRDQKKILKLSGKTPAEHPLITIKYLGLWDTVKTLTFGNDSGSHDFHVDHLEPLIERSRHAIALDEIRKEFDVTVISNLEERNRVAFEALTEITDAPQKLEDYVVWDRRAHQEMWFPGGHGSVGGGGDVRGLSDEAFLYVLEGAKQAGLCIDMDLESKLFSLRPNHFESLDNTTIDGFMEKAWDFKTKFNNHIRIGPRGAHEVAPSVIHRMAASRLDPHDEDDIYSPASIKDRCPKLWLELSENAVSFSKFDFDMSLMANPFAEAERIRKLHGKEYYTYKIKFGDNLSAIARDWMGSTYTEENIIAANKLDFTNPNRFQVGQLINLPVTPHLREKLALK